MAGSVSQPRSAPRHGPPNKMLAVVDVAMKCTVFTNGDGEERMALVLQFGKDAEDGGPGVWVLADQQQMIEQLKTASKLVRDGVRANMAGKAEVRAENVPEKVLELGDLTSGGTFDVSSVDIKGEQP